MSAQARQSKMQKDVSHAIQWLRAHAQPDAQLHADTRSLKSGDVFLAYAVEGADNRPYLDAALAAARLRRSISRSISRASRMHRRRLP